MSLKIKTAARLKALFAGVALSKKNIDLIGDQLGKAGLTDEATDEEIDTKLNERNALYSFEDQKKFDDYQVGKATKDAADKEAARLKALAEGKPAPEEVDPNETKTEKMLRLMMEKLEKQDAAIAAFGQEKVTNTRREQFIKSMAGTSTDYQAKELKKFDRITFKDDDDFTGFLEDTKEDHASSIQDDANSGLGSDRPASGGSGADTSKKGEASQAEMDAAFKNFKL
ncbi:MAG: hypothetical protein ABIN91_11210 [Mucilaginibacter sp.]|uniref:hypothetical protein n=1 Tax=Mucilaginibacter sp. TaxID=1882438 RepID=UPI0032669AB4